MPDPRLVRSRVTISYKADDGYCCDVGYRNTSDNPGGALLDGLEELARVTALFGLEDEAERAFNAARGRVAAWRANRADASGEEGGSV